MIVFGRLARVAVALPHAQDLVQSYFGQLCFIERDVFGVTYTRERELEWFSTQVGPSSKQVMMVRYSQLSEGQNHGSEAEYSQGKVHTHLLTMNSHQLGVRRQEITIGSMHAQECNYTVARTPPCRGRRYLDKGSRPPG